MYITKDVKHAMNLRKIAFKNRYTRELKHVEEHLRGKLQEAKRAHKLQLEKGFKSNNIKYLWDTMKGITGLSTTRKALVADNEAEFTNQLNIFFSWFDKGHRTR